MITPEEARKRTREIIEGYVNECGCRNLTDVQHVLEALISMAAQAVVATNGKTAAIEVLKKRLSIRHCMKCRIRWKQRRMATSILLSPGNTKQSACITTQ